MMTTTPVRRTAIAAAILLIFTTLTNLVDASEPVATAASFLAFETKIDGTCHNLSEGGKLQVMRNLHQTRRISFRLIRYFIDVRQQGRVTGLAPPAGETIKLGCTLVGGRPQRWEVERAEFTMEDN